MQSTELHLQLYYIDKQVLVICTGSSGEAYSIIEELKVEELIRKSISIHKQIDKFFPEDEVPTIQHESASDGTTSLKDIDIDQKGVSQTASNKLYDTKKTKQHLLKNLKELGKILFKYTFQDQILDLLNVAIGQAISSRSDVVLRLMIASDFLNIIPWELFHNNDNYLCHAYDVVRHPFIQQPVRRPMASDGNLRLLFVGANPLNDIYVKGQIEAVEAAVKNEYSELEKLIENSTYKNIASGIYDGVDILHFLAHGKCEYDGDSLKYHFLVFSEDEDKRYDKMPVEMLESFCRVNPMRLVILSACRSDQAVIYKNRGSIKKQIEKLDKANYQSMAHALIRTGVPCVIGMSHPISKLGAEILTRRFYRTVVERKESIYKAVRQVRLELFAHMDSLPPSDWLTPVLYSRDSEMI
jgi:CHAT domain-containing protein